MFIPLLSRPRTSQAWLLGANPDDDTLTPHSGNSSISLIFVKEPSPAHPLERRKGGGGKGRGKGSSGSSSSSKAGKTNKVPLSGSKLSNGKKSATSYGGGGGRVAPIPLGQPFAGRYAGGGRRSEVYGNSVYGSGYPGTVGSRGVAGLGFPFFFWPVVWPGPSYGSSSYLHDSGEYGQPDNSSRPGGALATAQFQSKNTGSTFYVVSDKNTVESLIGSLKSNCSSNLNQSSIPRSSTAFTNQSSAPRPEQALQYYRASSVALTLNGYNDTAALNNTQDPNASKPGAPLPDGTDTKLLTCLNETIGRAVPLVDAGARLGPPYMYTLVLVWVLAGLARPSF